MYGKKAGRKDPSQSGLMIGLSSEEWLEQGYISQCQQTVITFRVSLSIQHSSSFRRLARDENKIRQTVESLDKRNLLLTTRLTIYP